MSPEKRYINQRLNINLFYSEQLSVEPREKVWRIEEDPISEIIIAQH
jgi:hypothetical protein